MASSPSLDLPKGIQLTTVGIPLSHLSSIYHTMYLIAIKYFLELYVVCRKQNKGSEFIVCAFVLCVQGVFSLITAALCLVRWFTHCFSPLGFFGKFEISSLSSLSHPLSHSILPPTQHNKQFQCFVFLREAFLPLEDLSSAYSIFGVLISHHLITTS